MVGYIGDRALKHGEEMSAMLARAYVSSYQANYDYYVDKLGLTPKSKPSASGHYDSERLYKTLFSYASKLGKQVDGLFREHGSGKINGSELRYKLINVLNQSETALDAFFQQELQYIANKSAIDSMNDTGVERYIFIAVMDGKTSETCSGLNGEIFSVNGADIGVNVPPLHPNCGSEIIPYDEEDFLRHGAEMGYEEWLAGYAEEYFGVRYIAGGKDGGRPLKTLSDKELYDEYLRETEALAKLKEQYDKQGLKYASWMSIPGLAEEEMKARGTQSGQLNTTTNSPESDYPYVNIPQDDRRLGTIVSYMGWHQVTYATAPQTIFKNDAMSTGRYSIAKPEYYAMVNGRYVIATKENIGGLLKVSAGDYVNVLFQANDGTITTYACVIGDIKEEGAEDNPWGHLADKA